MKFLSKIVFSSVLALSTVALYAAEKKDGRSANLNYMNNRAPLMVTPYIELPLGSVKAEGWLQDQLQRMANGMTGHLDSLYAAVMGPRNGWLGGDGDVWERGPYWIDGLLPLAYILDDEKLKEKVQPWIEWSIASQQPDGYFGPSEDRPGEAGLQRDNSHDWWPKMVMLKVMQQYYDATGDKRVIKLLTDYFKYQLKTLPEKPLGHWTFWGERRGGDNLMVVLWLYNITGDEFLLDLADLIHEQTFDWTNAFYNGKMLRTNYSFHTVNLGQGMKEPIIYYQKSKDPKAIKAVKQAAEDIRTFSGWPNGVWAGDELLRSGAPTQGSELCTAVETMFSLEKMLAITGDTQWADQLERIAYNALPTQITDDFDARQYYQQINQIKITRLDRNFVTCYNGTDQLMGLLAGYPCCTSNLHQGWPKFTKNLWFATEDNGIAALVYAPSSAEILVGNGVKVGVKEETNYPFSDRINFTLSIKDKKVKSAYFPFHLRIPSWCEGATVSINGVAQDIDLPAGEIVKLTRDWKSGDKVTLTLPMTISASRWYDGGAAIERGPLVYALKMNENWTKVQDDRKFGTRYGDWYYEVTSDSPWNYCLLQEDLKPENINTNFVVKEKELPAGVYPWNLENAPVEIIANGKRMKEWQEYNGSAGPLPYSVQYQGEFGDKEQITLVPYGCTTLRIGMFPITSK